MALNIIGDFFSFISLGMFDLFSVLMFVGFVIWEIPQLIKNLISEEYTRGLYPETGRVIDIVLMVLGIIALVFLRLDDNADHMVTFLKTPGITAVFLVLMAVIPLIIALGYFKRFFGRMDAHNSITVFLTQAFLDLMHTIFYISLTILLLPTMGYVVLGAH